MTFGVYLPPAVFSQRGCKCPVLYYLSGLTCTHENFIKKAGAQQHAAQHGLIIVNPDTSPRNLNLPEEKDAQVIGPGGGWYVDATMEPWCRNYRMFTYITQELVLLINSTDLPIVYDRKSICGHSMGGHGALICALKCPGAYKSVSAFAPVANPMKTNLGIQAFTAYLGPDQTEWQPWDATCLVETYDGPKMELFIDQGTADEALLEKRLMPKNLLCAASRNINFQTIFKMRDGYDHSHYFVATFIGEHIAYHAKMLKETENLEEKVTDVLCG